MAGPSDLVLQIRRKRENGTEVTLSCCSLFRPVHMIVQVWEEGAHAPVAPRWQITIDSEMEGRNKMACRIANSAMLLDSTVCSSKTPTVRGVMQAGAPQQLGKTGQSIRRGVMGV